MGDRRTGDEVVPLAISTREGREVWSQGLAESISRTSHPERQTQRVVGWEIEAIRDAYLYTDWPEFLFLQDSTRIKDPRFWDRIDDQSGDSWLLMPRPNCYMALYQREVLDKIEWHRYRVPVNEPFSQQKEWALAFEDWFIREYIGMATGVPVSHGGDLPAIFPELTDANSPKREMVHGELRMVMENDYFVKYKGTFR